MKRAGTRDPVRGPPTRPCAGPPAQEGSEREEAGKVAVLRTMGGRSTEGIVTLLFGAKDAEHNNARALVAFVRELGGAA
jgi:hypothetical protein